MKRNAQTRMDGRATGGKRGRDHEGYAKLAKHVAGGTQSFGIPRDEWDFSKCTPEEREECFLWELARHCEAIRRDVARLHEASKSKTFDAIFDQCGKRFFSERARRPLAIFYFCPEFPKSPYQCSADVALRQARIRRAWGDEGKARARLLDARFSVCLPDDIGQRIARARRTKEPIYRVGARELTLLEIHWENPDPDLVHHFKAWLRENRPQDIEQWPDRGAGLPHRKRAHQLKQLGAWRLLQKMDWQAAAALTDAVLGKPLFVEQTDWITARRQTEEWLHLQEKFHRRQRHISKKTF